MVVGLLVFLRGPGSVGAGEGASLAKVLLLVIPVGIGFISGASFQNTSVWGWSVERWCSWRIWWISHAACKWEEFRRVLLHCQMTRGTWSCRSKRRQFLMEKW